jgi:hypothetical protein
MDDKVSFLHYLELGREMMQFVIGQNVDFFYMVIDLVFDKFKAAMDYKRWSFYISGGIFSW